MPQTENISERIALVMAKLRIKTRAEVARRLGFSRVRLYEFQRGAAQPSVKFLKALRAMEREAGIEGGENEDSSPFVVKEAEHPQYLRTKLPILPWERVEECEDYRKIPTGWPMVVPVSFSDPYGFAVTVEGDAMAPLIVPGDVVACAPGWGWASGDFILARLALGGVLVLRRVVATDGSTAQIAAVNPSYGVQRVEIKRDFDWAVRVVTQVRNLGVAGPRRSEKTEHQTTN